MRETCTSVKQIPLAGVAHQNGTIRFGNDPKTSVLDANCKAHDVDNLYVVDGSFFPSSAAVNPALTIMANALRVGDHLLGALGMIRTRQTELASARAEHCRTTSKGSAPANGRALGSSRVPFPSSISTGTLPTVERVDAIGITVSDMDRAVDFYSKVLTFEKVSDTEVAGEDYEHLEGVFGLRMRVVRMRLGDEFIELTEYLAPKGRPIPVDSRSNDRWFQHIAIIVSDMDKAYAWLRQNKVEHASSGPQRFRTGTRTRRASRRSTFKDPDEHRLEILQFPAGKGDAKWHRPTSSFSASTTPQSSSGTPTPASSSIATCSACMWRERARTTEPSRNI